MSVSYNRVNWKDADVSKTTPVNAANLNQMDEGIASLINQINANENNIDDLSDKLTKLAETSSVNMFQFGGLVTQAEYDALDDVTKSSGIYFIYS